MPAPSTSPAARPSWRAAIEAPAIATSPSGAGYKLLNIDELGYVPLSQTGAELLFEVFPTRHERALTIVTSNLPFDEWTGVFASERLTGALLYRLAHHVHILEMDRNSYLLKQSSGSSRISRTTFVEPNQTTPDRQASQCHPTGERTA